MEDRESSKPMELSEQVMTRFIAERSTIPPLDHDHRQRWLHNWSFVHKDNTSSLSSKAAERSYGSVSCWVDSLSSCSSSLSCMSTTIGSLQRSENAPLFQSSGETANHFEPLHSSKMEWVWPPVGWSEMDRKRAIHAHGVGKTLLNLEKYESPPPEEQQGFVDDSDLTMGPGDPYKRRRC
eukprot:517535-Hanusia_phi.AAC.5